MNTTIDFLNAVKTKHGIASDYALAKVLHVTRGAVSIWQSKKGFLDDAHAIEIADILDLNPAYVVACVHAERSKNESERNMWNDVAGRFAAGVAGVAFCSMLFAPADAFASAAVRGSELPGHSIHYAK